MVLGLAVGFLFSTANQLWRISAEITRETALPLAKFDGSVGIKRFGAQPTTISLGEEHELIVSYVGDERLINAASNPRLR
jgi:hypothetical protein